MPEEIPDPVKRVARGAAQRLAQGHSAAIVADVERALHTSDPDTAPEQYIDPVSLASLIVSAASMAWTVYNDLRQRTASPNRDVIARNVRIQLHNTTHEAAMRDEVIDIVVDELTDDDPTE